mmetsp:Transcript_78792/g.211544  ORF Transcript_78792/g.211544 Transcript_78792/m.211544 type:complete len:231 (-) Transcript_78792:271-963(-)
MEEYHQRQEVHLSCAARIEPPPQRCAQPAGLFGRVLGSVRGSSPGRLQHPELGQEVLHLLHAEGVPAACGRIEGGLKLALQHLPVVLARATQDLARHLALCLLALRRLLLHGAQAPPAIQRIAVEQLARGRPAVAPRRLRRDAARAGAQGVGLRASCAGGGGLLPRRALAKGDAVEPLEDRGLLPVEVPLVPRPGSGEGADLRPVRHFRVRLRLRPADLVLDMVPPDLGA